MSCTPDWMRGGEADPKPADSNGLSILAVVGWIAAIVVTADCLFVAQRFLG
jgi:hypothetical protein